VGTGTLAASVPETLAVEVDVDLSQAQLGGLGPAGSTAALLPLLARGAACPNVRVSVRRFYLA
jgi:hypothetical protein